MRGAGFSPRQKWSKYFDSLIADLESNATLNRLAWEAQAVSTSEPFRLENFTYSNDVVRNTIFGHLEQTNFRGVSVSELNLPPLHFSILLQY